VTESIWRTFRFYIDVDIEDEEPENLDHEDDVIEEALASFYRMIDDGVAPEYMEM
jgi:hypothetical protein